jgi:hypothetical protein
MDATPGVQCCPSRDRRALKERIMHADTVASDVDILEKLNTLLPVASPDLPGK